MKVFLLAFFVLFYTFTSLYCESLHEKYDAILEKYVIDGLVNYAELKNDRVNLDEYLEHISNVTKIMFDSWSENDQLAFLINLYNAATIQLIIDNYPLDSIRDIGNIFRGPWDQKVVNLFGEMITLDNLEHDIIRVDYDESRIHMVLVCAAIGCPPLLDEAYTGESLIEQMDAQTEYYLKTDKGLVLDRSRGEVHLSSIFKWYGKDFDSVPDFVAKYSGEDLSGLKIRWLDYDWRLNELE